MSLGERFRAAREQRGLTLSDVAEHLRIRSVYLAAIEEENWKTIGAPVYTRGFLRTYARYLGLDPEQAVCEFNAQAGTQPTEAAVHAPMGIAEQRRSGSLTPLLWITSLIALALIGFLVYLVATPSHPASVAVAPSNLPTAPSLGAGSATALPGGPVSPVGSASPAASPGTSSAPLAPGQAHQLQLHLTGRSWLRVIVDGNVSMEGTFPAGTTRSFHGKAVVLRVGNAGGVDVTVDGKPVEKLGGNGDVVEKRFIL